MIDKDRLLLLTAKQLHGELTSVELIELERVLLGDPAACQRYIEEAYLYYTLGDLVRGPEALRENGLDAPSPADAGIYELAAAASRRLTRPAPRALSAGRDDSGPVFSFAGINIFRQTRSTGGRRLPARLIGYAALIAIAIGVVWWASARGGARPAPEEFAIPAPPEHKPMHAEPRALVTIARTSGAVWDHDRTDFAGDALRPGQLLKDRGRLFLAEGFVELKTGRGATVLVEAPAQLELIDENTLHLDSGSLVAEVPYRAKRFTVTTPTATVIDLGTQFGVDVKPSGRTLAQVYRGRVEMSAAAGEGSPGPSPAKLLLRANQQATAQADGTLQASPQPIDPKARLNRNWNDVLHRPEITGQAVWLSEPPVSVRWNAFGHLDTACVFTERTAVLLSEPLDRVLVEAGTYVAGENTLEDHVLDAGARVDSYLVHLSPPQTPGQLRTARLTLRFPRPIAAVVVSGRRLFETDALFARPGVGYQRLTSDKPAAGRGLDPTENKSLPDDTVQIHDDGRTLSLVLHANNFYDQVRVLVHSADQADLNAD